MGEKMRPTAEGERKTETRIWTRNPPKNYTKVGKSESEINIGRQNIEYGTKESEIDTGRNSLEYDTKEIDPLKDKEEEENPEDDPDVQDIRWF